MSRILAAPSNDTPSGWASISHDGRPDLQREPKQDHARKWMRACSTAQPHSCPFSTPCSPSRRSAHGRGRLWGVRTKLPPFGVVSPLFRHDGIRCRQSARTADRAVPVRLRRLLACAVERRAFLVGANPARQLSLQPVVSMSSGCAFGGVETCLAAYPVTPAWRCPLLLCSIIRDRSQPGRASAAGRGRSILAAAAPSRCGPAGRACWRGRGASASRPSGRPSGACPFPQAPRTCA